MGPLSPSCYTAYMEGIHPKTIRRYILQILYRRYLEDPLEMLAPEDFFADARIGRKDLVANIHYLHDRGLVELMIGYNPPLFAAARITAKGIDMVENTFEFNLYFPPGMDELAVAAASAPVLMERLVQEAEFAALDGEARHSLLRDVQFLRDELARPEPRWRRDVIGTVFTWIAAQVADSAEELPSLAPLREVITQSVQENEAP